MAFHPKFLHYHDKKFWITKIFVTDMGTNKWNCKGDGVSAMWNWSNANWSVLIQRMYENSLLNTKISLSKSSLIIFGLKKIHNQCWNLLTRSSFTLTCELEYSVITQVDPIFFIRVWMVITKGSFSTKHCQRWLKMSTGRQPWSSARLFKPKLQ